MPDPFDSDLEPDWLFDDAGDAFGADVGGSLGEQLELRMDLPPAPEPDPVPAVDPLAGLAEDLIRCRDCGSAAVAPRSTSGVGDRVQFRCRDCDRTFVVAAPYGYDRLYRLRRMD